jgi:hypothetical protein
MSQPQGQTHNEQRRAAERQAARQPANAWQQPEPVEDDDDDDENGNDRSNFNRNLIVCIVLAVLAIALLSLLRHCNSQENDRLEACVDSHALAADNSQDPLAVFTAELSRNGMTEDKAYAGCAVKFAETDPDTPDRIVGVTYKEDRPGVVAKFQELVDNGVYPTPLWQK